MLWRWISPHAQKFAIMHNCQLMTFKQTLWCRSIFVFDWWSQWFLLQLSIPRNKSSPCRFTVNVIKTNRGSRDCCLLLHCPFKIKFLSTFKWCFCRWIKSFNLTLICVFLLSSACGLDLDMEKGFPPTQEEPPPYPGSPPYPSLSPPVSPPLPPSVPHYAEADIVSLQGVSGNNTYAVPALASSSPGADAAPLPELPRQCLIFKEKLGEGQFGEVRVRPITRESHGEGRGCSLAMLVYFFYERCTCVKSRTPRTSPAWSSPLMWEKVALFWWLWRSCVQMPPRMPGQYHHSSSAGCCFCLYYSSQLLLWLTVMSLSLT